MSRVVVLNASELCVPEVSGAGVERLPRHALVAAAGRVAWIGPERDLQRFPDDEVFDARGGAVLPALVDCHTHLLFAGDRVEDFSRRARGMSYAEIAAEGGGILTTVRATRAARDEALLDALLGRLEARRRYGIGTTEIKSGYGLSTEHELRMLAVVERARALGWDLEGTLLAAHAVPRDVDRAEYLRSIVEDMIPAAVGRARFADVFVERGAYTAEEAARIFEAARAHGLLPRLHADQLTAGGGAELAARFGAASADHLEHASEGGLAAMRDAGSVGVLLPGAAVFLGDPCRGLGRRMIDAGVEVAVATDANPGSSPMSNLPLAGTLAVTQMGLTAEEALRALTLGAARALRRDDVGTLAVGARARFIVLDHPDSRALLYAYGEPIIRASRFADGAAGALSAPEDG